MTLPKSRSDIWIYFHTFTLVMKRKYYETSSDVTLIGPHGTRIKSQHRDVYNMSHFCLPLPELIQREI